MKKLIVLFMLVSTLALADSKLDMVKHFQDNGSVVVREGTMYIMDLKWWNGLRVDQKETIANMFRDVGKRYCKDKIIVFEVANAYTGETLMEFRVWSNKIEVVE